MKLQSLVLKMSAYVLGGLSVAAAESDGTIQLWLLGALLAVVLLLAGAGIKWLLERQGNTERQQRVDEEASAAVAARVSVVEAKVEYLEGGKRVRFDLRLDKALLQEQIEREVTKQREEAIEKGEKI